MSVLPAWLRHYARPAFAGDLTAGLIVTALLIPQSLAYALLAGLPPQAGLYASILPLLAYAALGSSMTLAVGPVAVISLMTAEALAPMAAPGSPAHAALAAQLALLSGVLLAGLALLRLGFVARFLSQPVVQGFITGSALLIAWGQARLILGAGWPTAMLGIGTIAFLALARRWVPGLPGKLAPIAALVAATGFVAAFSPEGVRVVGEVPGGLPAFQFPLPDAAALEALWMPALLISLVGFVESVSVARSLRQGERIEANRELAGLGAANLASACSGGFPVTGGFARSVVNAQAGARTPMAGVIAAGLMAVVLAGFTGLFRHLPHAVLAATIIVAVASLLDPRGFLETWRYDRGDGLAYAATAAGVLALGVERGVLAGVILSLGLVVWRGSRPHIAVVGRIPGTEHFRNVDRHAVETRAGLLALRIDESLFFGNASAVEDAVERRLAEAPGTGRVLLVLSAVNHVDASGLAMLDELDTRLAQRGIVLQFAEVKGPVMDRLRGTPLGGRLSGRVFLTAQQAFAAG